MELETRPNLVALARWAEQDALPWLWSELAVIVSKNKVTSLKTHDAIRQGCRTSISDRGKMSTKAKFYVAQLTMFDSELRRHCKAVSQLPIQSTWFAEDAKVITLHGAIRRFLEYAIILLDQGSLILQKTIRYGTGAKQSEHFFEVFKGAEQVIYGRFCGMTHNDHVPYVGIAILRTAIEVRLRRAFGIQGLIDQTNGNFRPIDLSRLIEAIKRHKNQIEFAVDFDDTIKIYRWCNSYLHGAWRDFPWVPGFALQYLRPLLGGVASPPGAAWSINSGIKMPRKVWNDIRTEFDPMLAEQHGLTTELWNALKSIIKRRRNHTKWTLISPSEEGAACVFSD